MKIIDNIIAYFNRRKQLKLDKSKNEKINDFKDKILKRTEEIMRDDKYSTDQEKYQEIYKMLKSYEREAIELGILEKRDIEQMAKNFKENKDIQNAITFVQKEEMEHEITYSLNYGMDTKEFSKSIEKYIEKFCLEENKFKFFSEKEKFNIITEILKKNATKDILEEKMLLLKSFYKNSYFAKIIMGKDSNEVVRLYNEYVSEFLKNSPELESEFRDEFSGDKDILRKIDLINELGASAGFRTMEEVPLFFDMTKESVDQDANAEVANRKKNKDITAEDMLFIRTTQVFPKDGVVEHVGQYSEVETIGNPLMDALMKIDPEINKDELQLVAPRFRWTTHWCVNGIVGDHSLGAFSGRDFFIIEEASEQTENKNLLNMLVADVIFMGDVKLSSKARIMMHIEKYQELMSNPKMKKQLRKMNIILYKGNPSEALKMYMNERGYVYGKMSSFSYVAGIKEGPEKEYLDKIESSLKEGKVEGFEHCAYTSDEGVKLSAMRNPQFVSEVFYTADKETRQMHGLEEKQDKVGDTSIYAMSACSDEKLTYSIIQRYFEYLSSIYPEMQSLNTEVIQAIQENNNMEFCEKAEKIIRKIGVDKIKSATEQFNKMIKEEQKVARKQKDKDLLDKGLITQEEYKDRMIEEKTENFARNT